MRGIDSYAVGRKNEWRRQAWAEIARRAANPSACNVLYMPSDEDLDRRQAVMRGFNPNRMIGVELDSDRYAALKSRGVPVICADAYHVLRAWPSGCDPFDVVFLDTTNCFSARLTRLLRAVLFGGSVRMGATIVINIQCGRESGKLAVAVKEYEKSYGPKFHRGLMVAQCIVNAVSVFGKCDHEAAAGFVSDNFSMALLAPYVAKTVRMDTVIFTLGMRTTGPTEWLCDNLKETRAISAVHRKCCAAAAVRTRRLNGDLVEAPRR